MGRVDLSALVASAQPFLGPVRLQMPGDVRPDLQSANDDTIRRVLKDLGWDGKPIAYVSTYRADYTRTRALLAQFRRCGVAIDAFIHPGAPLFVAWDLLRARGRYGLVVVGFRGHTLLPLVRAIVGAHTKILFDAFVAVSDTLADRGYVREGAAAYRALTRVDRRLCAMADAVLVDTQAHAAFFHERFGCRHVHPLYVECDEEMFRPAGESAAGIGVLWYGTCLPLHGVEKIIRWAASLNASEHAHAGVRFRLIGPLTRAQRRLLRDLCATNVTWTPWVAQRELPALIRGASLCLAGPFGESGKAKRVIAGKTYQMLACGKPVLVSDTPANRELCAA